ncbi:hypothetical protein ACHELX_000879 [Vibrio vulnificus]
MYFLNFFSKKNNKVNTTNSKEIEGEKFFRQGIQYSQFGNQEEAITFFTRSIEASPNHSAVYLNRGACFMIQERYLEAFDDFSYVIEMEKKGLSIDSESCSPGAIQNIQRIRPFIEFEKKTGDVVREQLTLDGEEHFTMRWSEVLFGQFLDNDIRIAKQFIYEELKELEGMGGIHQEYALNSGVDYKKFSNVGSEQDTGKAFIMFKSVLCCFSRNPERMFQIRTEIIDKLHNIINQGAATELTHMDLNNFGRMHLSDAEVDIMFIVKNGDVLYINNQADSLYEVDKDGDLKLDGRIVNFIFRDGLETIQIFVAFDEQDSYSMFTMNMGRDDRLNYVAQAIFQFMGKNSIEGVFTREGRYSSQYHYTFKLYTKDDKHFMVNNGQSQAYLISGKTFKSEDVDAIKSEFWN